MSRTPLLAGIAAASFALFVTPAAVFWIGTNTNGGHSSASDWARVVGEAGSWTVLPVVVLAVCFSLLLAGRWMEARFVLLVVAGAGLLMYAARIVLQALGTDEP